ncbi:CDP-alcohol phosphatidyltransferase family protein [Vibrio cionasavignyae]|uniref:CDP-alcohol phosphatidyltransferase family protein n=1 Tax=Vibrio cionasavignyae TaxID=2910252 RepID=UPI003D0B204A
MFNSDMVQDDLKKLKVDLLIAIIFFPVYSILYTLAKNYKSITPNVITCFGLTAFLIGLVVSCLTGSNVYTGVGLYVFAGADIADGYVARKLNMASPVGAILDLLSDRLVFVILFFYVFLTLVNTDSSLNSMVYFVLYSVLFLYLDSLLLTKILAGKVLKEHVRKSKANDFNKRVSFMEFLFRADFRFSSYVPMIGWLVTGNEVFLLFAVIFVLFSYMVFFVNSSKEIFKIKK